ncbi:MAG: DNA polymerase III subunit alpha, partial [Alphaproteobacteria bacterium MarineAlpha4_Bin2]
MPHSNFVHLRVHSAYSLSEGALRTKDIIELCQRHRMPAVGITDSSNLFGALELSLAARSAGVQPIIGVQIGLRREGIQNVVHAKNSTALPPDQLVLLAQSEVGYENILALVSKAFLNSDAGEPPQVGLKELAERNE